MIGLRHQPAAPSATNPLGARLALRVDGTIEDHGYSTGGLWRHLTTGLVWFSSYEEDGIRREAAHIRAALDDAQAEILVAHELIRHISDDEPVTPAYHLLISAGSRELLHRHTLDLRYTPTGVELPASPTHIERLWDADDPHATHQGWHRVFGPGEDRYVAYACPLYTLEELTAATSGDTRNPGWRTAVVKEALRRWPHSGPEERRRLLAANLIDRYTRDELIENVDALLG